MFMAARQVPEKVLGAAALFYLEGIRLSEIGGSEEGTVAPAVLWVQSSE